MIAIFLADGFEVIEALTPFDALKRAGVEVKTVGVGKKTVTSSHGVCVVADMTDDALDMDALDGVILPGGLPGTTNLAKSETVIKALHRCTDLNKLVAAICAAPSVLGEQGLLHGKRATCYPGFEEKLLGAVPTGESVVTDGSVITGKGAGVSWEFALTIVAFLKGETSAKTIAESIQCRK